MLNTMKKFEDALESFVVTTWREAESHGDSAAWFSAYEHLFAVQAFLSCLHLNALAHMASDLKVLAGMRGEMCPDYAKQAPFNPRSTSLPYMLRAS